MKKKLSAYWWCQISGWGVLFVTLSLFYLSIFGSIWNFVPLLFLGLAFGVFITHIMRLLIFKGRILQLNILRQIIYILLTTIFFSIICALVEIWLAVTFHWGKEILKYFVINIGNKLFLITETALESCVLLGIWNLIYFSFHYIQKSQKEQIEKIRLESELRLQQFESEKSKVELQKERTELEMRALRAQMNPHFIFNSLNSIQHLISIREKEEAIGYLSKFSKLIRQILENSRENTVSIRSEMELLELYIQLEQLRFNHKFDYHIAVDEKIDKENTEIPPLLIQPYVENAILHGLVNRDGKGDLWLSMERNNGSLVCKIEDNGIGRAKALDIEQKKLSKHKSLGIKVTSERIATLSTMMDCKTEVLIEDLFESNQDPEETPQSRGTRVTITIPVMDEE